MLPWYSKFWLNNPDYIIIEWEKDHVYTSILDYYRAYENPIWKIEKNGAIFTGIYKFDPSLNYTQILSSGKNSKD
jgi:hypothetical protein